MPADGDAYPDTNDPQQTVPPPIPPVGKRHENGEDNDGVNPGDEVTGGENGPPHWTRYIEAFSAIILVLITGTYTFVAWHQWCEMRQTNKLTRQAIHSSGRAWVGVESITPNSLEKSDQGMTLAVTFSLKNYGHSAAENVRIFPAMSVLGVGGTEPAPCNDSTSGKYVGDVILPDQKREIPWGLQITNDEIETASKHMNPAVGRYLAGFVLYGCLEYIDDPSEKATHHTPFSYAVTRKMGKKGFSSPEGFIAPDTPHIDGDKLAVESFFGIRGDDRLIALTPV